MRLGKNTELLPPQWKTSTYVFRDQGVLETQYVLMLPLCACEFKCIFVWFRLVETRTWGLILAASVTSPMESSLSLEAQTKRFAIYLLFVSLKRKKYYMLETERRYEIIVCGLDALCHGPNIGED